MLRRLIDKLRVPPASAHFAPAPGVTREQSVRVLLIVYDPLIEDEGGLSLTQLLGWHASAELAEQYIADLRMASGGVARYEVVERIDVDEWPRKVDGFRYDDATFLRAWRARRGFHQPDNVDYQALLERWSIAERIADGSIDEVWLFAPPYTGLWESTMAGPGAFWCNSSPVAHTEHCPRRFVIMGFNPERGVDCMLENFGHRVESIMQRVYRHHSGERNMWQRFTRYDLVALGRAACGNVHFAPNSRADYDWGNRRPVWSECDSWLTYPELGDSRRLVDCREWGGGGMREHHLWWLAHLPRAHGTDDGVFDNWWHYILDPDLVP